MVERARRSTVAAASGGGGGSPGQRRIGRPTKPEAAREAPAAAAMGRSGLQLTTPSPAASEEAVVAMTASCPVARRFRRRRRWRRWIGLHRPPRPRRLRQQQWPGADGRPGQDAGGGAGLGGAIFVQQGGSPERERQAPTVAGECLPLAGAAQEGKAPRPARASDGGFSSRATEHYDPRPRRRPGTQTISDAIADQTGIAGSGGSWSISQEWSGHAPLDGRERLFRRHHRQCRQPAGQRLGPSGTSASPTAPLVVFDQTSNGHHGCRQLHRATDGLTKTGARSDLSTDGGTNTYSGVDDRRRRSPAGSCASAASLGTSGPAPYQP